MSTKKDALAVQRIIFNELPDHPLLVVPYSQVVANNILGDCPFFSPSFTFSEAKKSKRPCIGVTTTKVRLPGHSEDSFAVRENLIRMLQNAGAIGFLMPHDPNILQTHCLDYLDGYVLSGGGDPHPETVNSPVETLGLRDQNLDKTRDSYERRIIESAYADKPLWGICRGAQMIANEYGGLLTSTEDHLDPSNSYAGLRNSQHQIQRFPSKRIDSWMSFGLSENSAHHLGIAEPGRDMHVIATAISNRNTIVEAFESKEYDNFVIATQWHPEFDIRSRETQKIARKFVQAAKSYGKRKFY